MVLPIDTHFSAAHGFAASQARFAHCFNPHSKGVLCQKYAARGETACQIKSAEPLFYGWRLPPFRWFPSSRGYAQLKPPGRYPVVGQACSVLCFLAVRELELTATELAGQMGWTQPAISMSVKRGAGIVKEKELNMDDFID